MADLNFHKKTPLFFSIGIYTFVYQKNRISLWIKLITQLFLNKLSMLCYEV